MYILLLKVKPRLSKYINNGSRKVDKFQKKNGDKTRKRAMHTVRNPLIIRIIKIVKPRATIVDFEIVIKIKKEKNRMDANEKNLKIDLLVTSYNDIMRIMDMPAIDAR